MSQKPNSWNVILVSMILFLILVSGLAYFRLIPTEIKSIPYYDSIGHFALFGLFGFFAEMAFKGKKSKVFGMLLPTGVTITIAYACLDEALQITSASRTFDLHDLGFGVLGIICFYQISRQLNPKNKN